jgi:CheY-like chemotaxis protein
VIENISINAMQAMPLGGKISIRAENYNLNKLHPNLEQGRYVKISMADKGTGIPPEFLNRIFDPFFTTKAKGHGLGLATCYSIINKHKGTIEVESDLGKGTTFHLYLPASDSEAQPNMEAVQEIHRGQGIFLIMDDEEVILITLGEMLEYMGYEVVKKTNGKEALEYFIKLKKEGRSVKGMIFDLTIPGAMGGKEAVSFVRELDEKVPVFVSSGYSEDPVLANPKEYGFTGSIRKPFAQKEISLLLNKYIKNET